MPLYSGMWAIPAAEHVQWHVGELQINARGETALHLAVRSGSAAAVSYLLESATAQLVDVDARGAARAITAPPFTTSAPWSAPGRMPLHVAALEGHVEAARVLLEHGCHTGVPCGFECETPLAFAIKNGHLRLVQLLYS